MDIYFERCVRRLKVFQVHFEAVRILESGATYSKTMISTSRGSIAADI